MKKRIVFLALFIIGIGFKVSMAQVYETISSSEGIVVKSITVNQDRSLTVEFFNSNRRGYERAVINYSFEWYLSYKGKRVSDYYQESIVRDGSSTRKVYCWPGEVPAGNEKYVTVQFGKESTKPARDRRDDD